MDAITVIGEVEKLLLKIFVLTGWQIHEDIMQNILIEQMSKKLVESYPNVNVDEVEYAFRNKSVHIKDWGKQFNISLLDEVLIPYAENRMEISLIEEQVKSKPIKAIGFKEDISNEGMRSWINEWVTKFKSITTPLLIPPLFYEWLIDQKEIDLTKEQKFEYLNKAIEVRQGFISETDPPEVLEEFLKMKKEGLFTGIEVERLKEISKKLSVYDYLKTKSIPETK